MKSARVGQPGACTDHIGGFIGRAVFGSDIGSFFDLSTWLLAILGSLIVLGIYHVVTKRGHRSHS
ncbi:GlsB/YeaQ/YmgE family stress response membrane protein [Actinosynnema sp. NPDC059335]|uniref:GlsB/YeaQ/YmgE family stress response membrane protein n=1 Tax=Actinosynnema sp. NPDC059335 TaxID=3346804 RepID=UPI003671EFF9